MRQSWGPVPRLVAADAGFHSNQNQAAARARGVGRVCIPDHSGKSPSRKREQKKRWFRNGQRAPDARDASVSASVDMACSVAAIVATMA